MLAAEALPLSEGSKCVAELPPEYALPGCRQAWFPDLNVYVVVSPMALRPLVVSMITGAMWCPLFQLVPEMPRSVQ